MLRFAADEDFNNDIVRGLRRRRPDLDIVRVQEAGLSGAVDPDVLEWAARQGRVLLTHDVSMMTRYAHERVRSRPGDAWCFPSKSRRWPQPRDRRHLSCRRLQR
jgi:hypothetical protein